MKRIGGGSLVIACAMGCGSPSATSEVTVSAGSPIQGGADDPSHPFAVGIIRQSSKGFAICSGALLAPNLVATARHCVSDLSSAAIDCATSAFGAVTAPTNLFVTTDSIIGSNQPYDVARIVVPSGANQTGVCGNDIALLILAQNIHLTAYVTPAIDPPMTNHVAYTTNVTAIGYGINTPADTNGMSAGTRRIRQGIGILCIPNDPSYPLNCYKSDPKSVQFVAAGEFVSGDGTCEGDSGSSAFEQSNFNRGKWVSFGVLSRGGLSDEGGTCAGSIYTRFDAWAQLLSSTAGEAAKLGGYPVPAWAGGADAGSCAANGSACNGSGECCSSNCLSRDGITFACAMCDCSNPCDTGFACRQGVCVTEPSSDGGDPRCRSTAAPIADAATIAPHTNPDAAFKSSGCACVMSDPARPLPWYAGAAGLAAVVLRLARRRKVPEHLSGSRHNFLRNS